MKYLKKYQIYRNDLLNESLAEDVFIVYHRTKLVDESYVVTHDVSPDENVFETAAKQRVETSTDYYWFQQKVLRGIDLRGEQDQYQFKNSKEFTKFVEEEINFIKQFNKDIPLDSRGYPIVKKGDKIVVRTPQILSGEFKSGEGDMYGSGFYSCYELRDTIVDLDDMFGGGPDGIADFNQSLEQSEENPYFLRYGKTVVEASVQNNGKFLILDMNELNDQARKVWGPKHSLIDQLKKIMKGKFNNFYKENKETIDVYDEALKNPDKSPYIKRKEVFGKDLYLTSDIAYELTQLPNFFSLVDGIAFTGKTDSRVLVVFNMNLVNLLRYSEDDGKTWKSIKSAKYSLEKVNVGGQMVTQVSIKKPDTELAQILSVESRLKKNQNIEVFNQHLIDHQYARIINLDISNILNDDEKAAKYLSSLYLQNDEYSLKVRQKILTNIKSKNKMYSESLINKLLKLPIGIDRLKHLDLEQVPKYYNGLVFFLSELSKLVSKPELVESKKRQILDVVEKEKSVLNLDQTYIDAIRKL